MNIKNAKQLESLNSVSMGNSSTFIEWAFEAEKLKTQSFPFGDNKAYFKKVWGKQNLCWIGWERNWIWCHELDSGTLVVYCSTRGTTYEFAPHDEIDIYKDVNFRDRLNEYANEVIEFLNNYF